MIEKVLIIGLIMVPLSIVALKMIPVLSIVYELAAAFWMLPL